MQNSKIVLATIPYDQGDIPEGDVKKYKPACRLAEIALLINLAMSASNLRMK